MLEFMYYPSYLEAAAFLGRTPLDPLPTQASPALWDALDAYLVEFDTHWAVPMAFLHTALRAGAAFNYPKQSAYWNYLDLKQVCWYLWDVYQFAQQHNAVASLTDALNRVGALSSWMAHAPQGYEHISKIYRDPAPHSFGFSTQALPPFNPAMGKRAEGVHYQGGNGGIICDANTKEVQWHIHT